ncbi:MAG: hypothetical protein IJ126_06780 [Lachnospiraceae bacterium]|nr:hypothetical protein [Lachnospiraceae bacterium]
MIYTVTFNPSLDYIVRVDNFKPGVINRTTYENILPGGKGINVSIVLSNLGHKSVALGFMAGEGAVFISENGDVLRSPAPEGTLVNSVGAGDSMVAGFISGYLETGGYREAFRMGIAAGSASAFSPDLATRPEVEALLQTF